ncbi:11215_t:CDS:2 [Gigaspora rosea]|nr:11214_t:CDS:2 [Gigaspora rosea]CAG8598792.1 11215_t:CDS:2 [Gigaspora rosea]
MPSQEKPQIHQGLKKLNKILKQATKLKPPVSPQHLKAGEVVTEPAEIKHEIAQHYEHWTQRNTPNELLREE